MTDIELSSFGDFRLGDWIVQPRLNRISRGASTVPLELKMMQVLVCLAKHSRDLVTRQELIDTVWATEFIGENVLTRAIAEIRKALGDDARKPSYIETIHRRGYRLLVTPSAASDEESSISRTVSHYLLLEHLGAGGMGVVYRGHDTRLDRDVAIKTLPEELARDEERLARFAREAKLLASLNHPNIATLYGLDEHRGRRFLVMELAEGESLAERIAKGPLPIKDAIEIALQIAEGLEASHEHGVIHRDLKPANVMVDPEGRVKILDFGLAKAFDPQAFSSVNPESLSESPTLTADLTHGGVLLGTATYMSPEQASGKPVDKRADIWAFGCVLFEMLTGACAFSGATLTEVIAGIIKEEPAWDELPPRTPPPVRRLLSRCLTKIARDRIHDIADVRIELQSAATDDNDRGMTTSSVQTRARWRISVPWVAAVVGTISALVIGAVIGFHRERGPTVVSRVIVATAPGTSLGPGKMIGAKKALEHWRLKATTMVLSPDGRRVVYVAHGDGVTGLISRGLDDFQDVPLPGTEGAESPFFSPDGEWIGFWADGGIRKVRAEGGPAVPVCDAPLPYGASWGIDGSMFFGQHHGGVMRVSADGGIPNEMTVTADGEISHRHPQLLADGDTLVFTTIGEAGWDGTRIVALSRKTGDRKILVENGADARFAPTGHLVFVRLGSLMAVPFDSKRLEVTGSAVLLLDSVRQGVNAANSAWNTFSAQYCFSRSGNLVHVPGGAWPDERRSVIWADRGGNAKPLSIEPGPFFAPRLSPDGTRLAVFRRGFEGVDIWAYDISRDVLTRVTFEDGDELWPVWTPDNSRITFVSGQTWLGDKSIKWIPTDGSGSAEELLSMGEGTSVIPASWSPDGSVLAFLKTTKSDDIVDYDIWMLPRGTDPRPFIESPFAEIHPAFSPDGRWLAYSSKNSGRNEVYVTPYPGPGPRIQVSTEGGFSPTWASNGRELFFRAWDTDAQPGAVWKADISLEPKFSVGVAQLLITGDYVTATPVRGYDVASDGQRFLMTRRDTEFNKPVTQLHLTLNWFEELKRLVPTD